MKIETELFGTTQSGEEVRRFTLRNDQGMTVRVLEYGCTIQSIELPQKDGEAIDVVLGYDNISGYETGNGFFGAFVGRYANRIRRSAFVLNGKEYRLPPNEGANHLHGLFSHQVFRGSVTEEGLLFRHISPNGEEGYPGALSLEILYTLDDNNALTLRYRAQTDADTVLNLSNHSYFNLNGDGGDVLKHTMTLHAQRFTEGDSEKMPTGRILPVDGTPMDFRQEKAIGQDIFSDYEQLSMYGGYDHNYVLEHEPDELFSFATIHGDKSGISMECLTTQPGVQFYTGNSVAGDLVSIGKYGMRYPRHGGFCLETQHYPCSPNIPSFPSTVLHPGEVFDHTTVYRFF